MIHEIKNRYELTLQEFVKNFGLEEEFEKQFGTTVWEWDNDMEDEDVVETLLEKYRPENNYIIVGNEHKMVINKWIEIIEI
tara:strand:- start:218 stop:460 length:243 start_codon:yes stop_codon:yes gene_type:complete